MIGIISNDLAAYTIIDRIKEYNNCLDIYLYNKKVDDYSFIIDKLINKKCKIIIIPSYDNIEIFNDKYSQVKFLSLENKENGIDSNLLIKAILEGNELEVRKVLDDLNIKNKEIVINNPTILFIKEILEKDYQCKIIDNITDLINKIDLIIGKDNINNKEGNCYYIN